MVREPAPARPPEAMLVMKNLANSVLLLYFGKSACGGRGAARQEDA
jgi:hypothetical protein